MRKLGAVSFGCYNDQENKARPPSLPHALPPPSSPPPLPGAEAFWVACSGGCARGLASPPANFRWPSGPGHKHRACTTFPVSLRAMKDIREMGGRPVVPKGQRKLAGGGERNERNHRNTHIKPDAPRRVRWRTWRYLPAHPPGRILCGGRSPVVALADSLHHQLISVGPPGQVASIALAPHFRWPSKP